MRGQDYLAVAIGILMAGGTLTVVLVAIVTVFALLSAESA